MNRRKYNASLAKEIKSNMKVKLKHIVVLSILATIGIVAFQISWLKNSYQISREKIRIEKTARLEQAIKMHEKSVAKIIRKKIIFIIKNNPNYYIKFNGRFESTQVGFDGPNGEIKNIGPLFNLTKEETKQAKKNSYDFLIQRIGSANLEELENVLNNATGSIHNFAIDGREETFNLIFEFRRDTITLNKFLKSFNKDEQVHFTYETKFYKDILDVFGEHPDEYVEDENGLTDSTMLEESASYYKLSHGEKLDSLDRYIRDKNETGNLIYIARPLFDIDSILNNKSPVILLSINAPPLYVLSQMLYSIIGSFLLLMLIGFCLWYMFYIILKQKKLSEIKDDFISNVSHELKTPVATTLAAVQGMQYFDVLKDKDKTNQYLATAAKEMHRLSTMIDTILNSAIYERSDFSLNLVKFNFKEMLEEMISALELHAKKEIKIRLNYQINEEVLADKIHLYNIFNNLIDNAIKYGKDAINVKIEVVNSVDGIKILVSDNGIGIPTVFQKNIFDKFFRVPSPTDHSVKGYGLGLNYVKCIIEKHNGSIILAKSDSSGSTFEINLPQ